jgi:methyl-accepting chemotaxis protein
MAWKDVRLSLKFFVGFGVVLALLAFAAGWSIVGIRGIVRNANEVIEGNKLRGNMVQREVDHLVWVNDLNKLLTDENVHELLVETDPRECAFGRWYYSDARVRAEALVPEIKPILARIEGPHAELHESAVKVGAEYVEVDGELGNFLREKKVDHLAWAHRVKDIFVDPDMTTFVNVELDPTRCDFGLWLYSDDVEELSAEDADFGRAVDQIFDPHARLHESAGEVQSLMAAGSELEARQYYMSVTKPLAYEVLDTIDGVIGWHDGKLTRNRNANRIYSTETNGYLGEVKGMLEEIVATAQANIMTDEAMLEQAQRTNVIVIIIGAVSIVLGILLAVVIARGIILPLGRGVRFAGTVATGDLDAVVDIDQKDEVGELAGALNRMISALKKKAGLLERVAGGDLTIDVDLASNKDSLGNSLVTMKESLNNLLREVKDGIDQVASGASQISDSSQNLSQGATEQASSLEEISSSITEISGQSQQNAKNATEATSIAKQAAEDAEGGNRAMTDLKGAMERMNRSSDEIQKVVKLIDDIAFQINLLALNANVEAARAGKYGKGFAVVAEEVRNLASRSADAVQETSRMVEDSLRNIQEGNKAAEETAGQLERIVDGAGKVASFLDEIAEASREQADAITEINTGIDQIDQVTQSNTANAEESASAAEELAAQAQQIRSIIAQFKLDEGSRGEYGKPRELPAPGFDERYDDGYEGDPN